MTNYTGIVEVTDLSLMSVTIAASEVDNVGLDPGSLDRRLNLIRGVRFDQFSHVSKILHENEII